MSTTIKPVFTKIRCPKCETLWPHPKPAPKPGALCPKCSHK